LSTENRSAVSTRPQQQPHSSGVLQFLGVACLIVCVLFVIVSLPFFLGQIRVVRSWPVRQAQILRSEVVTLPAAKHDQLYAAQLQIAYVVDGQPITVQLTSFQSSNYEDTVRRAAEYPVGSRRAIRYNPQNPSEARIGAGWNRRFFAVPLITLGCGLIFAAIAAALFLTASFRVAPKS
jgi:hypothetical protein